MGVGSFCNLNENGGGVAVFIALLGVSRFESS